MAKLITEKIAWLPVSVIGLVMAIYLVLGFARIANFAGVDEPYWLYDRVPNFWNAVENQQWNKTKINDKPGITIAIVSGLGLPWTDPVQFKADRDDEKDVDVVAGMQKMNTALRLPLLILTALLLPLFYFFTSKLYGRKTGLFSVILVGLSPILLGISLIINPDALFWVFVPLSILSLLLYQKEATRRYLILSGVFFGLALLTKYVANILYFFYFGLFALDYIFFHKSERSATKFVVKFAKDYTILVLSSIVTFAAFFPAAWVDPKKIVFNGTILSAPFKTLSETVAKLFSAGVQTYAHDHNLIFTLGFLITAFVVALGICIKLLPLLARYRRAIAISILAIFSAFSLVTIVLTYAHLPNFDFSAILGSPKSSYQASGFLTMILADFFGLLFGISPLALLLLIFALIVAIRKKEITRETSFIIYAALFILLYYVSSTTNEIAASVRYQVTLYPLALVISAIGLSTLFETKRISNFMAHVRALPIAVIILFTASLIALFTVRPYYFAYSSSLLPTDQILNLKDMGDGSYQAAQYLNNLPDAKNLIIWSDKGAVCEFFVGTCKLSFDKEKFTDIPLDYLVVSAGRRTRSVASAYSKLRSIVDLRELYDFKNPTYTINIDGRPNNYVKIVKSEDILKIPRPKPLTLGIFSDAHYTPEKALAQQQLQNFVVEMEKVKPDVIINLGDLIEGRMSDLKTRWSKDQGIRNYKTIYSEYENFPNKHTIIGNHDLLSVDKETLMGLLGEETSYFSKEYGLYKFIFIDTQYTPISSDVNPETRFNQMIGNVPQEELAWLRKELDTKKYVVLFSHDPLTSIRNASAVLSLLSENSKKILVAFSGHVHKEKYYEANGVQFVSVPSITIKPRGYMTASLMGKKYDIVTQNTSF